MDTARRDRLLSLAGRPWRLRADRGAALRGGPRFFKEGLTGRIAIRPRPLPAGLLAATDDEPQRRVASGWEPAVRADSTSMTVR
jgi:hypothetical protein